MKRNRPSANSSISVSRLTSRIEFKDVPNVQNESLERSLLLIAGLADAPKIRWFEPLAPREEWGKIYYGSTLLRARDLLSEVEPNATDMRGAMLDHISDVFSSVAKQAGRQSAYKLITDRVAQTVREAFTGSNIEIPDVVAESAARHISVAVSSDLIIDKLHIPGLRSVKALADSIEEVYLRGYAMLNDRLDPNKFYVYGIGPDKLLREDQIFTREDILAKLAFKISSTNSQT